MLRRDIEAEIPPVCPENNIGAINHSPMQSGLLTDAMNRERIQQLPDDDYRHTRKQFQRPQLSRNLKLANLLRSVGAPHQGQAGVVAIAWTLANPRVTAATVGGRDAEQVQGDLPAADFRLNEAEYDRIARFSET